jgi:hypothetical protein
MTISLNLDGVEAWTGSVILKPGTHPVTVTNEEVDETGDHPVVVLQLEAIGGDEPGAEVRDWVHITANTLGRIAQLYKAFNVDVPSGDFNWIPVKGRNCKVLVREEPKRDDPSQMRTAVKAYLPLTGDAALLGVAQAFGAKVEEDIPF